MGELATSQTCKVSETLQVSNGFKETEIGPIPVDWDLSYLGEVASLNMGQSPPSSTYNTIGEGMLFLQGKAEFGRIYPTPVKWCSEPKKVTTRGSVLISVRAPVGDVNVAKDEYCIGRGLAAIDGEDALDNWFLFYLLTFAKQRFEDKATGSTFKSINKGVLQNFPIPLPPLPEQRCIAHVLSTIQRAIAVLSTIQRAIAAQDDLIAAARETKRSLMHRLFTYGPGPDPAPTKETEIGDIPEHWETTQLGKITERPQYGYTASASEEPIGPKFLRITDIQDGQVQWGSVPYCEIDTEKLDKYRLRRGDVLIARIGATTGKTYLITQCPDSVFASYLIRVRTRPESVTPGYLHYFTDTEVYWTQINASKGGRLKQGVNIPVLASLIVPLAPFPEQYEIAHILNAVDCKIAAEQQRKSALEALFQSTLQQLMTGQIRINAETQRRGGAEKKISAGLGDFAPLR